MTHLSLPPYFDGLLGSFDEDPNPPSRAGPANQFKKCDSAFLFLIYNQRIYFVKKQKTLSIENVFFLVTRTRIELVLPP